VETPPNTLENRQQPLDEQRDLDTLVIAIALNKGAMRRVRNA
jgi:hypothetical protein